MANERPKAETKKYEDRTIGGRVVRFYTDGRKPEYQDTGEVYDEAVYQLISAGDEDVEILAPSIDKDVLFWGPSYEDEQGKTHNNPIRGCIIGGFPVPEQFAGAGFTEDDESDRDENEKRYALWVFLRKPTMVKNRDKKWVQAKPGDIVWMDVRRWNTSLLSAAAPRRIDPDTGLPTGMVEFMLTPEGKRKFTHTFKSGPKKGKTEPRFTWSVKLQGGWSQAMRDAVEGKKTPYAFKAFNLDEMRALGARLLPPTIETMEQAIAKAGLLTADVGMIDLGDGHPALPGAAPHPALPERAAEPGLQN